MLDQIMAESRPAYLRLGAGPQTPDGAEVLGTVKHIVRSANSLGTVVALGPVVANVLMALQDEKLTDRFDVFTVTNLPLDLPADLTHRWAGKPLLIVEEHVSVGGLAGQLSVKLLAQGAIPSRFVSLSAQGYPNGLYGDQKYHQQLSGLDPANVARQLTLLLD